MRVDFSQKQFQSEDEQKLVRLMRGLRAVATSIVVAGIGVIAVSSIDRDIVSQRGVNVQGTDSEYSTGALGVMPEALTTQLIG